MAAPASSVVGFIDMDCFYVSVEVRRDPSLKGLPVAVCQYEAQAVSTPTVPASADRRVTRGGAAFIAVSYEARARGVTRMMLAAEGRRVCPELITVMVPTAEGKADLAIYKDAGQSVCDVLQHHADRVEKRSVDEVAIDVTHKAETLLRSTPFPAVPLRCFLIFTSPARATPAL